MLKGNKVHIHKIGITQVSETKTFRLPLPFDLGRITGIILTENTVLPLLEEEAPRTSKADYLYPNFCVGQLKLVERGYSNDFFAGEVIRNDNAMRYGDFAELDFYNRPAPATPADFHRHEWFKAGTVVEDTKLDLVPCSGYLKGFYQDRFNEFFKIASTYTVSIYLFYKPESPELPCEQN